MRPITIIPTSTASTSSNGTGQIRLPAIPTKAVPAMEIANGALPTQANQSEITNGRPSNDGTLNHSNPEPAKLNIISPLSPSLSTASVVMSNKKTLSKSESKTEVTVTKKPPPAVKRISLLSDSISKFEQTSDGTAKPKVSWKSFIKPSPSKDKLAVVNNVATVEATAVSVHEPMKTKPLDENNNEVKSEAASSTKPIEPSSTASKPALKPKPLSVSSIISQTDPSVSTFTTRGLTPVLNAENLNDKSSTVQNGHHENGITSAIVSSTTGEENTTSTPVPPVKVKKIVKKIVKKVVTKSSSDLSTLGETDGEKVVRIVKKKVIKAKQTDGAVEPMATPELTNNVAARPATDGNKSDVEPKISSTHHISSISEAPQKLTLSSAPITIEPNKYRCTPEILVNNKFLENDNSTVLLLNGKTPDQSSHIRPMLPAHRSHTIELGTTEGIAAMRLPPTPPTTQSYHLSTKGSPPLRERRRSWGKLDKMSLSLSLSRDSTLDDFSRESSILSRSTSPYSLSSTRSSSVLSNFESPRSMQQRRLFTHSLFDESDLLHSRDYSPLEHTRINSVTRASPAPSDRSTTSDYLSEKIEHFLRRTDHVAQEWKKAGKASKEIDAINDMYGTYRSKSVSSIMSRGLQLLRDQPSSSRSSSRMSSISRDSFHDCMDDDNQTVVDDTELSEMTAELAEEHSSSNLISERLDAETTERLRLEKEVKEHESKYRNLQESSEKLEMELLCAKSDLNGDLDDDLDADESGGGNAYRLKYERVARELEFTKKRLQTQHEHDLEQLIALKKQLEKKLSDAYEEVEEQRQVVGQWKRKAQKMTNEMNDLRMLLEEQNSRNNLLEKRQRKFDSECQALQDSARQEKQAKERLAREKDVLIAEKFTIEQALSDVRLELELKEEKYSGLQRELEEITFGGGTEEEIAQLKRQKMELDRRCKEQEEELDEMAGQIQLLEQAKLRLEMSLETMRKDGRKEAQQRDDELEEIRGSSYKKIKSLECQLEQEHEERTLLLREKHELERRLNNLEDQDRVERAAEEAASQKLKRDLRKYKALLRDAQSQLERAKTDSAGKALIRQLRNQLEDAESARSTAVKARQVAESELQDVQLMLEEAQRARFDSEEKATSAQRDRTELQAQIDENEEEMAELMKKYSATVKQLSSEQAVITDYELKISELDAEKKSLKEQISDLTARLENVENIGDSSSSIQFKRLELRTKELESRLEFEQATRARMEIQLNRHKDSLEKAQHEISQIRTKEMHAQEALKKAQKTIRELREELHLIANKEQDSLAKRKDLEKRLECSEAEAASARADLRLALQRIADLQQAMEEGDSYHSDSENSDSSIDSVSEINFHSSSNIASLRAARSSGETNGASTNGSGTTLCIREEKENTPRIRSKFRTRFGLRRRRLPCTIAEEEEADEFSAMKAEKKRDLRFSSEELDTDVQLDSVIESIKCAISEDGDDTPNSLEDKTTTPKYTGAIKKTVAIPVKGLESNDFGRTTNSLKNGFEHSTTKSFRDVNNNATSFDMLNGTDESVIACELERTSDVVANHLQLDDSRFDLNALKSIKEKIRNINLSLKEEAAAKERCPKYEFPPPLSTESTIPAVETIARSSPDVEISPDTLPTSLGKLDHIDSQLNVAGIRSMKEKIRNLKKKLQEDSILPSGTVDKEQIVSEICEMKKTLTAAFISKAGEKAISPQNVTDRQKRNNSTSVLSNTELREEKIELSRSSSASEPKNACSPGISTKSIQLKSSLNFEANLPPNCNSVDHTVPEVEQASNRKQKECAIPVDSDSAIGENKSPVTSSANQGEVVQKTLCVSAAENNDSRESLLDCPNPLRERLEVTTGDECHPMNVSSSTTGTTQLPDSSVTMKGKAAVAVHSSMPAFQVASGSLHERDSEQNLSSQSALQLGAGSLCTISDTYGAVAIDNKTGSYQETTSSEATCSTTNVEDSNVELTNNTNTEESKSESRDSDIPVRSESAQVEREVVSTIINEKEVGPINVYPDEELNHSKNPELSDKISDNVDESNQFVELSVKEENVTVGVLDHLPSQTIDSNKNLLEEVAGTNIATKNAEETPLSETCKLAVVSEESNKIEGLMNVETNKLSHYDSTTDHTKYETVQCSAVAKTSKQQFTCNREGCSNGNVCKCENIDRTVELLTKQMEESTLSMISDKEKSNNPLNVCEVITETLGSSTVPEMTSFAEIDNCVTELLLNDSNKSNDDTPNETVCVNENSIVTKSDLVIDEPKSSTQNVIVQNVPALESESLAISDELTSPEETLAQSAVETLAQSAVLAITSEHSSNHQNDTQSANVESMIEASLTTANLTENTDSEPTLLSTKCTEEMQLPTSTDSSHSISQIEATIDGDQKANLTNKDKNNNEAKGCNQTQVSSSKAPLKSNKTKYNSHHGSLRRNSKTDSNSKQTGTLTKSNPSSRRSSQADDADSIKSRAVYSNLAKGEMPSEASLSSNPQVVEDPLTVSKNPIEDISKNQVSRRALVEIDRNEALLNEHSSCSAILLTATVSADVTATTPINTAKTSDQQPKPRPLSYAESLKNARSPQRKESSATETPWAAIKKEFTAKASRTGKQQQSRIRHSSLAREGGTREGLSQTSSHPSDKGIRQSKSASKIYSKELRLASSSGGIPLEYKINSEQGRSQSGQRNGINKQLTDKGSNKSNSNLLQNKKPQEARADNQTQQQKSNQRQNKQSSASNYKKK